MGARASRPWGPRGGALVVGAGVRNGHLALGSLEILGLVIFSFGNFVSSSVFWACLLIGVWCSQKHNQTQFDSFNTYAGGGADGF